MKTNILLLVLAVSLASAGPSTGQRIQFRSGGVQIRPPQPPAGISKLRIGTKWNDLSTPERREMNDYFGRYVAPRWRPHSGCKPHLMDWVNILSTTHKINEYAETMANPEFRAKFTVDLYVATNGNDTTGNGSIQKPFATIQTAILAAKTGQTIGVQPGSYKGIGNRDINLNGKGVVIRSTAGPYHTTLDCGRHRILQAVNNEPVGTKLIGFTIRNGFIQFRGDWSSDGLIRIRNASLEIACCVFNGNEGRSTYLTSHTALISAASNHAARIKL